MMKLKREVVNALGNLEEHYRKDNLIYEGLSYLRMQHLVIREEKTSIDGRTREISAHKGMIFDAIETVLDNLTPSEYMRALLEGYERELNASEKYIKNVKEFLLEEAANKEKWLERDLVRMRDEGKKKARTKIEFMREMADGLDEVRVKEDPWEEDLGF